jgi:hypothetical protein
MDKKTHRERLARKAAVGVLAGAVAASGAQMPANADQLPHRAPISTNPLAQPLADSAEPAADPFEDEEQAERAAAAAEQKQARLDSFAMALSTKRRDAVEARRASGIEQIWREDEDFYEGVDDANRAEGVTLKPRDQNGTGGASIVEKAAPGGGSTIFVPITRPYVDFSAGRAADMLLPTDDQNWDIQSTPMPDVIAAYNDERPMTVPGTPFKTVAEAAKAMVKDTSAKVAKAKKRIQDWLEESQYNAEQRKVLLDAAKVGVGILKGPFPVKKMSRAVVKDPNTGGLKIAIQNKTAPVSKRISYWNFYPSKDCGDDIHKGSGTWEKDSITARELRDLKGTIDNEGRPMYLEAAIGKCLEEGPQKKYEGDGQQHVKDGEVYEIWYYHGIATAEDLRAAGVEVNKTEVVPVIVTMVNDRVIKAELSTLDSGSFPYDVMVWQPREGYWAGIGVARQVRPAQRMLNGAVRNLMDNAGLGAGPQLVFKDGVLVPADPNDDYSIRPRKFWKLKKDTQIDDVRKAFAAIDIPMVTQELMTIVEFALKTAEDCTGMPMLMQGQQGKASTTVGGMQLLTNNSNTPMRMIAKQYDDRITEPHITRYYEWLLLYGPEQDEKGEFIIAARGSSALFERDAQNQAILQMAPLVKDPAFKINPEKWYAEYLKAQRLDPNRFQYTPEEWATVEEQQKNSPPPVDPRIQAAQINAEASVKREEIRAETVKHKTDTDLDRDNAFVQQQNERTRLEHEARLEELALRERLAMLEYANREKISLETLKVKLADTSIKARLQKELATMTANGAGPSREVTTPPTEPPGRAERGEAYQA